MELPSTVFIAIGVILSAVITGFISIVNLILSKEQKISEFRQNWIDELRKDLSSYSCNVQFIAGRLDAEFPNRTENNFNASELKSFYASANKEYINSIDAYHRVLLRLNSEEDDILLKLLEKSDLLFHSKKINFKELADIQEDIIKESQQLLKREWKRVKKGEVPFRATKWISSLVLISALLASMYFYSINVKVKPEDNETKVQCVQSNKKIKRDC